MNFKVSMFALSQVRKICTSPLNQKNHYESLGIGNTATQADVKSAYYELSKVYHPDRNQGHTQDQREKHSQKFRDITEAYEVLGNVKSRKMYDKGYLSHKTKESTERPPEDPLYNFYKSRNVRTRPPTQDGKQPIYDFDEWSRKHYGESVRRVQEMKQRRAFYEALNKDKKESAQYEFVAYGGFFFIVVCMIFKETYNSVKSLMSPRKQSHSSGGK